MRNSVRLTVIVIAVTLCVASMSSAGDKPFFDMQNCELCKVFMEDPMLMANVQMEHYEIPSGIVGITTVKDESLPAYRTAHKKMMKQIERMEQGDTLYLCGYCDAIGALMERGMKYEYAETEHGDVSVMSSDAPEVIADIKALAAKGKEEMKKMEMMKKEGMKK